MALSNWADFDGWCAARNVDSLDLYPDRFVNLVYHWLRIGADEKRRDQIDRELEQPPAGETRAAHLDQGAWSADAEMAAFTQAARHTSHT